MKRNYHFTNVNHKRQSYDIWFLRYGTWQTKVFVILDHFLSFYPPNNLKNQNFEKMKKTPSDITILHMCTINDNHMMYGSWDRECNEQNFLLLWTVFCPFTPLTTREIKILKKWKKCLEISSFYTNVPKIMIIGYTVLEIRCVTDIIFIFYVGLFFAFLPLYQTKKAKSFTKWKMNLEILSYYTCLPKIMITWRTVPEIWCAMDRRTDGRIDGRRDRATDI